MDFNQIESSASELLIKLKVLIKERDLLRNDLNNIKARGILNDLNSMTAFKMSAFENETLCENNLRLEKLLRL